MKQRSRLALVFATAAYLYLATMGVVALEDSSSAPPRINAALLAAYEQNSSATANVMITMRARPDTVIAAHAAAQASYSSRGARISSLRVALQQHAETTQASILQLISKSNVLGKSADASEAVKSFWISNQIYVQSASLGDLIQLLANQSAIAAIDPELIVKLNPPPVQPSSPSKATPEIAEWNVVMIRAPNVWDSPDFGTDGSGVTVGIIDTGVRGTHAALRDGYLNDGHAWFDPYDESAVPRDGNGHGTHCAGTILGKGGSGVIPGILAPGIGVAPGAKWIACKGLNDEGSGYYSALLTCGEFMLCPTDPRGEAPDCDRAPQIVSNSWGGGQGDDSYKDVIAAWHAAGIIPVFAIGNDGDKGCGSAGSPGDQLDVISVGATTNSDSLVYYSSLGPSVQGHRKPEISAPGHYILSANFTGDSGYMYLYGTSMATPHVSGVIALLLSHKPGLSYHNVKSIIESSADQDLIFDHAEQSCGGLRNSAFPNNHFGYGRINAYKALQESRHYSSHAIPMTGGTGLSLVALLLVGALTPMIQSAL